MSLTPEQISFLEQFIHPTYLNPQVIRQACKRFTNAYQMSLNHFLPDKLAADLEQALRQADSDAGYDLSEQADKADKAVDPRPTPHSSGLDKPNWRVKGPPHKARYCILTADTSLPNRGKQKEDNALSIFKSLRDTLFPSPAFRMWLTHVTALLPKSYH